MVLEIHLKIEKKPPLDLRMAKAIPATF